MIHATGSRQIYLALGHTDMRKAINGLSLFVEQAMNLDPFSGHYFAFSNRRRDRIKILYWDRNGFCLWQKRLEKDRFQWPHTREDVLLISNDQLSWLLDGLDITQAHQRLTYSSLS